MNKKIIGIFVCMLFVGAAFPSISSTEKSTVNIAISPVIDTKAVNSMPYEECNCSNQTGNYGLGCLPLLDSVPPTPVKEPTAFLTELDWRNQIYKGVTGDWLTSVKNQELCGSCWAFAAIGCLEAMINIAVNNPNVDIDLSEQYMISCGTSSDSCTSGNAYYCYQYMKEDSSPNVGALPESCFPYTSQSGSAPPCTNKCSDWKNKLIEKITDYGLSSGSSQIKSRLAKGPVCLSFEVYDDFYWYEGGVYEYTSGDYAGRHQVVCVGYSDSGGYWICKNSWGSEWGESGYFKIKYGECEIESEMVYCDFYGNLPPNIPSNPSPANHATNIDINGNLEWTGGDPFYASDTVTYDVYFGTSSTPPKVSTSQSGLTYDPGTLDISTKYYWKIVAMDNHGASTSGIIWDFSTTNDPPNKPNLPSGDIKGKLGEEHLYTSNTNDSNDDQLYYLWDWGDGTNSGWLGPYNSGVAVSATHIWKTKGNYDIKVKAKDEHDAESLWSDPFPVKMPYSYNKPIPQFLELLFQRFPNTFPLLRQLLGY